MLTRCKSEYRFRILWPTLSSGLGKTQHPRCFNGETLKVVDAFRSLQGDVQTVVSEDQCDTREAGDHCKPDANIFDPLENLHHCQGLLHVSKKELYGANTTTGSNNLRSVPGTSIGDRHLEGLDDNLELGPRESDHQTADTVKHLGREREPFISLEDKGIK